MFSAKAVRCFYATNNLAYKGLNAGLQMIHCHRFFQMLLLCGSLSLLPACETVSSWREGITGERSKDQLVDGPRRLPVYNPKTVALAPAVLPNTVQIPQQAPKPKLGDHYAQINAFDEEEEDFKQEPLKGGVDYTAFDRYNNDSSEIAQKPKTKTAEKDIPAEEHSGSRKSFFANPKYSKETEEVAPIPAGPVPVLGEKIEKIEKSEAAVSPQHLLAHAADEHTMEIIAEPIPMETAVKPPMPLSENDSPSSKPPGFFDRLRDSIRHPFKKEEQKPQPTFLDTMDNVSEKPYPNLSSVPQAPTQLKDVKQQSQDKKEQLQSEYLNAQKDKNELASEPSELTPLLQSSEMDAIQPPSPPAQKILPDVNVQAPVAVEEKPAASMPMMQTENIPPPLPPGEKKAAVSFWDRIGLFKKKPATPSSKNQNPAVSSAEENTPPVSALGEEEAAAPLLPQPEPEPILRSASGEELPSLRSSGAPVAPVSAVEQDSVPKGLPSTQTLQKVKQLPSSRYSGGDGAVLKE